MITLIQALLRLLGVYFILRSINSVITFISILGLNYDPSESGSKFIAISVTTTAIAILLQLIVAVGLILIAPKLARMIVGRDKEIPSSPSLDLAVVVSSAMLIAAWSIIRMVDYIYQILLAIKHNEEPSPLTEEDTYHIIVNIALFLTAVFLIKKSPVILKKLKAMDSPKNPASPETPSSL
ncbi:hypothetical protein Rhal01_02056 [Rubritalea halochordaticola]|uniref:Integral membrane protein n=1 Tax=Rubritalea halochordaticola TaxID=714537 RepID=A0ABP9V1M5_9BACT